MVAAPAAVGRVGSVTKPPAAAQCVRAAARSHEEQRRWPVAVVVRSRQELTVLHLHRGADRLTAVTKLAQRGVGSRYGTSGVDPYARWFRYPAGFAPCVLAQALSVVGGLEGARIVDPFCGAGTVGTAVPRAAAFVGIEAHPLIAELASLKLRQGPSPAIRLRRKAERLAADFEPMDPALEHPLVRRCFKPDSLAVLAGLRDAIAAQRGVTRRYLKWALLGTLRDVAAVKVGWPYQRPAVERVAPFTDPASRFVARASFMADDLRTREFTGQARILRGDARYAAVWNRAADGGYFDGCVTSPPYLNNFDYADATRLELFFLGYVSSWAEMCREVRSGMMVATTQQSRMGSAQRSLRSLDRFGMVGEEIADLTADLVRERAERKRGKEYDQLVPSYFSDLVRVLRNLHRFSSRGARSAVVIGDSAPYGIRIDTPRLLGGLAEQIGFELVDDQVVRSRGARWTTNGTRHQVPLCEQLLTLVRR